MYVGDVWVCVRSGYGAGEGCGGVGTVCGYGGGCGECLWVWWGVSTVWVGCVCGVVCGGVCMDVCGGMGCMVGCGVCGTVVDVCMGMEGVWLVCIYIWV